MNCYVQIMNNIVVMKIESEETLEEVKNRLNDSNIIDVTNISPQPFVNYIYENNEFSLPSNITIENIKMEKLKELNEKASIMYTIGFFSDASGKMMWYDSDKDTQDVINRQYLLAINNEAYYNSTIFYEGLEAGIIPIRAKTSIRDLENSKVVQLFNREQIIKLGNDLAINWSKVKRTIWELQEKVNNATTIEEVMKINWPYIKIN